MNKRRGLGRGLEALIPSGEYVEELSSDNRARRRFAMSFLRSAWRFFRSSGRTFRRAASSSGDCGRRSSFISPLAENLKFSSRIDRLPV